MNGCSYLKSVAAVFFAAICAYLGAWLFPSLSPKPEPAPAFSPAEASIELEGIAIRTERPLEIPRKARIVPQKGQRIAAGALIWTGSDGGSRISGKSAIFMDSCDGLEYLAPPEDGSFGPEMLSAYLAAEPKEEAGQARLVEGFYWYYAALAPDTGSKIAPGRHYLRFEGFEGWCRAELIESAETGEGRALLFRLSLGDTAYLDLRKCRAELLSGFAA